MKGAAKSMLRGAARLAILPLYLWYTVCRRLRRDVGAFQTASALLSLAPGMLGLYTRREFYRMTLKSCSNDCFIGFGTLLAYPEAEIGARVWIGARCTLGLVSVGDDALLGGNVDVCSGRHQHGTASPGLAVRDQSGRVERVSIGAGSWIGNSAVILASVGRACVVGAGSVVVHETGDACVVVGNPARVVRDLAAPEGPVPEGSEIGVPS